MYLRFLLGILAQWNEFVLVVCGECHTSYTYKFVILSAVSRIGPAVAYMWRLLANTVVLLEKVVLKERLSVAVCGRLAVSSTPRSVHGHLHAAPLRGHGPCVPRVGGGADRRAGDQQARSPPAHPRVTPAHPQTTSRPPLSPGQFAVVRKD